MIKLIKNKINIFIKNTKNFLLNIYGIKNNNITSSKKHPHKVAGLGNAIVDYVIQSKNDNFINDLALHKGNMNPVSLEHFNKILSYFDKESIIYQNFCGSVANTISGLESNNIESILVSCVGDDKIGEDYIKSFKEQSAIRIRKETPTSKSLIIIHQDATRTMCTAISNDVKIDFDYITQNSINKILSCKILIIEGYLFFNPANYDAIEKLCIIAKSCNILVFVLLSDSLCVRLNKEQMLHIINSYADVVVCNKSEYLEIKEDIEANNKILKIITMDKDGALIVKASGLQISSPAIQNVNVVDTTGAGDSFLAGFLIEFISSNYSINDNNLIKCLQNGNLMASKIISKIGGRFY